MVCPWFNRMIIHKMTHIVILLCAWPLITVINLVMEVPDPV